MESPLATLDYIIIILFFIISLAIGLAVAKRAGRSSKEYFLSGRDMPWWLLGISMVATTFAADTPNFVTEVVRTDGVAGNWIWWAFLLTGMLTVFVYARLWRRLGVETDLEFYEVRYSGRAAAFLRLFRAIYLGFLFNVMTMAVVCLAAIKIGSLMLGLTPVQTVLIASVVTVVYTTVGGLRGVIWTDFMQFILAMVGTIWAAIYLVNLPEVGGWSAVIHNDVVRPQMAFFPDFSKPEQYVPLFFIPLAVQWWSVWYPGTEPGGGGYIAQRMLSAKDEKNAVWATLLFNIAHYALRPWPWIVVGLTSLIVFPNLASIQEAYPDIPAHLVKHDLAYPAMLSLLPTGLLGLVVASLISAFMSTISTHLNWGASYMSHDVYKRFIRADASDNELILVGRVSTVIIMIVAAALALNLGSALQGFNILLQIGAGTGLLFILRWFWWRINAWSELSAMLISFLVAIYFELIYEGDWPSYIRLVVSVAITTIAWVGVTLMTRPTDETKLISFLEIVKPYKGGWMPIYRKGKQLGSLAWNGIEPAGGVVQGLLMMIRAVVMVYALLFGIGSLLYDRPAMGSILIIIAIIMGFSLVQQMVQEKS